MSSFRDLASLRDVKCSGCGGAVPKDRATWAGPSYCGFWCEYRANGRARVYPVDQKNENGVIICWHCGSRPVPQNRIRWTGPMFCGFWCEYRALGHATVRE